MTPPTPIVLTPLSPLMLPRKQRLLYVHLAFRTSNPVGEIIIPKMAQNQLPMQNLMQTDSMYATRALTFIYRAFLAGLFLDWCIYLLLVEGSGC